MNSIEKVLREALAKDPADWSIRLELATKVADRGAGFEAAGIVADAQTPPRTEAEYRAAREFLASFEAQRQALDDAYAAAAESPEPVAIAVEKVRPLSPPPEAIPDTREETALSVAEDAVEAVAAEPPSPHEYAYDFTVTGAVPLMPVEDAVDRQVHERALIVGEGEAIPIHDRPEDKGAKASAVSVAVLVHAAIFVILGFVVVATPRPNPPQIVGHSVPSDEDGRMEITRIEKVQRKAQQSAAARMEVIASVAASAVSAPAFDSPNLTFDPIGVGDTFGMSMNFTDADGAGMVSFFGSRTKAQKVVFVVDASASMKAKGLGGKTKFELMKEELIKSITALPPTVEFQIVFFTGPSWFVGEDIDTKNWHELMVKGKKRNFWHYKDGESDQLPQAKYIKASASQVRKVSKQIQETKMVYGTDWREPLKMAMNLEPDVIYFMTDGAVGTHPDKPPVVEDVLKFNKSKSGAKINSICLMQLKAFDMLKELADKSKGEFTLVLEDGTPVRGRDIEKMAEKGKGKPGK